MFKRQLSILAASAFALVLLPLAAQAAPPEGRWEGSVQMPDRAVAVIIELVGSESGWLGDIELPDQTAMVLPLDRIEISDGRVVVGSSKIPGNATFSGAISDDGQTFSGEFSQGDESASFSLALNAGVAPEVAPPDPFLYEIDRGHSRVGFAVRHFTVSKVRGKFNDFGGMIRFDPDDLASSGVEVTIDAASIDTEHEQRDGHLRSPDFFDVENNPTINFKSTSVEKTDDGFEVVGDLTMRGVTRAVNIPFTMVGPIQDPLGMMRLGIEGGLKIDRREFGLEWNRAMETGGLFVGHEVEIELSAEAAQR